MAAIHFFEMDKILGKMKDESGKKCSPVHFGNANLTNPPAFFGGSMLRVYV